MHGGVHGGGLEFPFLCSHFPDSRDSQTFFIPKFPGMRTPSFLEKSSGNESSTVGHQMRHQAVTTVHSNGYCWSDNCIRQYHAPVYSIHNLQHAGQSAVTPPSRLFLSIPPTSVEAERAEHFLQLECCALNCVLVWMTAHWTLSASYIRE